MFVSNPISDSFVALFRGRYNPSLKRLYREGEKPVCAARICVIKCPSFSSYRRLLKRFDHHLTVITTITNLLLRSKLSRSSWSWPKVLFVIMSVSSVEAIYMRYEYHFCLYIFGLFPFWSILFSFPILVPKMKNYSYFSPYHHLTKENCTQCITGTSNANVINKIITITINVISKYTSSSNFF